MTQRTIICPYCASQITGESTICPGCQEDLAALAHLEYADAIHYNQALALAREGRTREAKAELSESLVANSAFAPSYALLAKICARELDWNNARINVKKALSLAPEDEAIVRLADEIINRAPSTDVAPYVESIEIAANPTAIDRNQTIAEALSVNSNPVSSEPGENPAMNTQGQELAAEVAARTNPAFIPARSAPGMVDRRPAIGRRYEPASRPASQSAQSVRPSSYLLPPQEATPTLHNSTPIETHSEPATQPPYLDEAVDMPAEPEAQPYMEPAAAPTEATAPASDTYEQLFKGSLWRTLGMGILITAGLAILIRAISGED